MSEPHLLLQQHNQSIPQNDALKRPNFTGNQRKSIVQGVLQHPHQSRHPFHLPQAGHWGTHNVFALDLLGGVLVRIQVDVGDAPDLDHDVLDPVAEQVGH